MPAKKKIVAEKMGIPFLATKVVSRNLMDVSIIPEPINQITGKNSPLLVLIAVFDFMHVR